jgi:diguanylate cyclase (GGDEF)-like protein/PAS domain S-box-containing protein
MIHLLAGLLRPHDPGLFALVIVETLLGCGATMSLLRTRAAAPKRALVDILLFGMAGAVVAWVTFLTALAGTYPKVSLAVPAGSALPAVMMSVLSRIAAAWIHQRARRSARNAMFAGSLLAGGYSCMLFIGMAGLVRPFALGYDLVAVLVVGLVGAALYGFALLERASPTQRHPWLVGTGLSATAMAVLSFGSLAAVLPFDAWMAAVSQADNLASSPIAIIIAAEAVGVLALGLSGALVDNRVAARDRLESERLRQLADSAFEGILIHRDGAILDVNASLATLLGLPLDELRTSPVARFLAPDADLSVWHPEARSAATETDIIAVDGSRRPVEILSRTITYHGEPAVVTALRDVRERRASEARIRFLAHHDMLTELPNRVLLAERLEQALAMAARTGAPLAVLCLDLDGFKLVNDTLGHGAGDLLLCQVAQRLRDNVRGTDFVSRLGGDEFVILQTSGTPPEQSSLLAQRIVECFAPSFRVEGRDVNVGVSIGIAIYPQSGDTATALLKNADIALYHAKDNGRGWFCHFETGMDREVRERRAMEQDLRGALQHNDFTLNYQPLFGRQLELIAFEALLRWTHPRLGPISPAQFVPLAEQCGIIIPLGEWVMRTACAAAATWPQACRVAVNLSPTQFLRGDLRALVADILSQTGLPPHRLELEITEGVLMDDTEAAIVTLRELRELGTRLVLDDFGTGFSSLSYLQRFAFDKLKVDRSFVMRLETDPGSRAIVNAIIAMSHSLNIEVVAEGVETTAQLEVLRAQGCDAFQGFLLGVPMPQAAATALMRAGGKARPGALPPSCQAGDPAGDRGPQTPSAGVHRPQSVDSR